MTVPKTKWMAGPLGPLVAVLLLVLASCGDRETPLDHRASPPPEAVNPDDPAAYSALAKEVEVELTPLETPEVHRGSASTGVLLLWPREDVRIEGLTSYAIEADAEYDGTGYIEFRKGNQVLWRSPTPFEPARAVTVEPMPREVREGVEAGDEVTWTVDLGPRHRSKAPRAKFKMVREPKVVKKIDRIKGDRRLDREAPGTRDLLIGDALLSYRLYTESLTTNLSIAQAHPDWMRPFQGIVTALRRLDLEDSSLWTALAPHVRGAGKNAPKPEAGAAAGGPGRLSNPELMAAVLPYAPPTTVPAVVSPPVAKGDEPKPAPQGSGPRPGPVTPPPVVVTPTEGVKVPVALQEKARAAAEIAREAEAEKERTESALRLSEETYSRAQEASAAAERAREASASKKQEAIVQVTTLTEKVRELRDAGKDDEARAAQKDLDAAQVALAEADQAAREAQEAAQRAAHETFDAASAAEAARRRASEALLRALETRREAYDAQHALDTTEAGAPKPVDDATRRDEEEKRKATDLARTAARERLDTTHRESQAAVQNAKTTQTAVEAAQENVRKLAEQHAKAVEANDPNLAEKAKELAEAEAALQDAHREATAARLALAQARRNAIDAYQAYQRLATDPPHHTPPPR